MDMTPIVERLSVIANCVHALRQLRHLTYEEFAQEHIVHTSAERDFQVAIQAALDISSILLSKLSVETHKGYKEMFVALAEVGIIPSDFAQKLVGMAGFRNILVHMYLQVDLRMLYAFMQHNLEDFELFAKYISDYLQSISMGTEL